jgi:ATP-dependent Clp protease adaptor protein ClpS
MKDMQHYPYCGVVTFHPTVMGTPAKRGSGGLTELEGELMLAEPVTKAKRPPMYKVTLLNDDFTPMDFVVTVIEHIFRKTHEEAVQLMLTVHEKGSAIVGVYTREVAETKVDQTVEYARINEHPLQCAMEPE